MSRITTNHRFARLALLAATAISIAATVGGSHWS